MSKEWGELRGPAVTWRKQGHGLHEHILFLLQAQITQSVMKFEQRLQEERLETGYKTQEIIGHGKTHKQKTITHQL